LLLCESSFVLIIRSFLDLFCLLCDDEFNVAVGRKVGTDSTVSSEGSSSSLDGSLNGNVGNVASLYIESLGFGVGVSVLEERENVAN
jgi:hypothetical protein